MELPKAWYTIKEVAAKWGCTEDDVLHQAEIGNIRHHVRLHNCLCECLKFYDDGEFVRMPLRVFSGYAEPYVLNKVFDDAYSAKEISGPFSLRVFLDESTDDDPDERAVSHKLLNPTPPVTPSFDNLYISAKEIKRFEAESMKSAVSAEKAESTRESTRLTENLLKTVVAIAIDVYGHDPAAKQNTTVSDIMAALKGVGVSLAENTVRDYLKKGAELIER